MSAEKFNRLLEPITIKNVRVKNRMVKPPSVVDFAEPDGSVGDNLKNHIALAKGGVGMIVVETTAIDHPLGVSGVPRLLLTDDRFIPGFVSLVKAIHKYDCRTWLQLQHAGPAHPGTVGNSQPVSASALSDKDKPRPSLATARELSFAEIEDLVEKFAAASERARKAGFDGVELHFAHDYLVNSFLSAAWNKRQDKYGAQNLENRTRFAVEIMKAVRQRVGSDYPLGIRMNGWELGLKNGLTMEETVQIASVFAKNGADHLHITAWGYGAHEWLLWPEQIRYPEAAKGTEPVAKLIDKPGALVPPAEAIKKIVSIPVIAVGRLNAVLGEWILENGMADLIALGRSLVADPELPNKIAAGKYEEVRPCTACLVCFDKFRKSEYPRCQVNAAWGKQAARDVEIVPARKKKQVMVVGGGPAGMEAARVAAIRGHDVVLYEKGPHLGGLLRLAATVKGPEVEDVAGLMEYLTTQVSKLGIKVKLGEEVTPTTVSTAKPDVVILANGGIPAIPSIPGMQRPNVHSLWSLGSDAKSLLGPLGKRVVIVGGLIQGSEAAMLLVKNGRQVVVTEPSNLIGAGIPEVNRLRLVSWLERKTVPMLTGVKYEEINQQGLEVTDKDGKRQIIPADTILVATSLIPDDQLFKGIQGKVPEIHVIGDAKGTALIADAIEAGFTTAQTI